MTLARSSEPLRTTETVLRGAVRHRLSGHAAEIAFYALLTLIPATVTVGSALHLLSHLIGNEVLPRGVDGAIQSIRLIIGPKLSDAVVGPFVRAQLTQRDGGAAITSLLLSWWLTSRLFYAVGHGLDVAYGIEHRPSRTQRMHALLHAVVAVVAISGILAVMALGWRKGSGGVGRWLGLPVIAPIWLVLRWPLLLVLLVFVVLVLYRYSPNIRQSFVQCLPGAITTVLLALLAGLGFRAYLFLGAADPTGVSSTDRNVRLIGDAVGASVATAVFIYVIAVVVLLGAELNAELQRQRANPFVTIVLWWRARRRR